MTYDIIILCVGMCVLIRTISIRFVLYTNRLHIILSRVMQFNIIVKPYIYIYYNVGIILSLNTCGYCGRLYYRSLVRAAEDENHGVDECEGDGRGERERRQSRTRMRKKISRHHAIEKELTANKTKQKNRVDHFFPFFGT